MATRHGKDIVLTSAEQEAYLYLGIIASRTGWRERNWKRKERIAKEGLPKEGLNLTDLIASNVSEEMFTELWEFRKKLVHGVCRVRDDGRLSIWDRDGEYYEYSLADLKGWALEFWHQALDNTTVSMSLTIEENPNA